jgi:hypothetical protein
MRMRVIENDPLQERLPRGLILVEPDKADETASNAADD